MSATQAQNKAATVEVTLGELRAVACDLVYEQVFDRGSARLGTTTVGKSLKFALKLS